MPLDIEREHTLTRAGNPFERFGKMQFQHILAVWRRPGKRVHAVTFRAINLLVGRIGDFNIGSFDSLSSVKALIWQPDIPGGIGERFGSTCFDADGFEWFRRRDGCCYSASARARSG